MNKLYLVKYNRDGVKYDVYNSMIVSTTDEKTAAHMHPRTGKRINRHECAFFNPWTGKLCLICYPKTGEDQFKNAEDYQKEPFENCKKCSKFLKHIKVEYLGDTEKPEGVILANYSSG